MLFSCTAFASQSPFEKDTINVSDLKVNAIVDNATMDISSIASNGLIYVGVGGLDAMVRYSYDGDKWNTIQLPFAGHLEDIIWTGTQFVATGNKGWLATSNDGVTWQKVNALMTGIDEYFEKITYSEKNGYFGISEYGDVFQSKDLVHWTLVMENPGYTLNNIVFLHDKYFAMGSTVISPGTFLTKPIIYTSSDGCHWEKTLEGDEEALISIKSIAWGNGNYVACSSNKVYVSNDGLDWKEIKLGDPNYHTKDTSIETVTLKNVHELNDIVWNGKEFVAAGSNIVMRSADGVNWSEKRFNYNYSQGLFKAVYSDSRGDIIAGYSNTILLSRDGQTYKEVVHPSQSQFIGIATDHNSYVAITESGKVYQSKDGFNWSVLSYISDSEDNTQLQSFTYGNGIYVTYTEGGQCFYSRDAIHWLRSSIPYSENNYINCTLYSITFDGTSFILCDISNKIFWKSEDGVNWRVAPYKSVNVINRVIYVNNIYFGTDGMNIFFSKDGTTWINTNYSELHWGSFPEDITYANGMYIGTLSQGRLIKSYDGITWTKDSIHYDIGLYSMNWTGSEYIGYGRDDNSQVMICESKDGKTWSVKEMHSTHIVNEYRNRVICDSKKWIFAGDQQAFYVIDFHDKRANSVPLEKIYFSYPQYTISPGQNVSIEVNTYPDNATNKNVKWISSNETVAKVSGNGEVLGISPGKADITAISADGSLKATCSITVNETLDLGAYMYWGNPDEPNEVSTDKEWNISLVQPITQEQLNKGLRLQIRDNDTLENIPITVALISNGKEISIKPKKPLVLNKLYLLMVDNFDDASGIKIMTIEKEPVMYPLPSFKILFNVVKQGSSVKVEDKQENQSTGSFQIPDVGLNEAIRSKLNLSDKDSITMNNMKVINNLNDKTEAQNISNLEGLQYAVNLTSLVIDKNDIEDISQLSSLKKIISIDLGYNKINNLIPLSGLGKLEYLYLYSNNIEDLSPLAGLYNLKWLSLRDNLKISNVTPIGNLKSLVYLDLYNNKISKIDTLVGLANLEKLNLGANKISDFSKIGQLKNLQVLNLDKDGIKDAGFLKNNKKLTEIDLQGNELTDVSFLLDLPSLGYVDISNNKLSLNKDSNTMKIIEQLQKKEVKVIY